jgi:hypothetical protein
VGSSYDLRENDNGTTSEGGVDREAVAWFNGAAEPTWLGDPAGFPGGVARHVSADGSLIAGNAWDHFAEVSNASWVWTAAGGMELAGPFLQRHGIEQVAGQTVRLVDVSDDGRIFLGNWGPGDSHAFVAIIPEPALGLVGIVLTLALRRSPASRA